MAAQIAVTMVLLVGAGLLMKSFVRVMSRDLRFDTERLLTFEVHLPLGDYLQRRGTIDGLPYFEISPPPSIALRADLPWSARDSWSAGGGRRLHPSAEQHRRAVGDESASRRNAHARHAQRDRRRALPSVSVGRLTPRRAAHA